MTYVWKGTMSFIQVYSMKRMIEHQKVQESICIKPYHNRAANNTRQCTPTHNQPQSVKSQKGMWTHNKLLVLVNNCDYTNTVLPAQPSDQWLATYVPPSSRVHVQYTTIATSHKTLLDLLDVRVQLQFKCTHTLQRAVGSTLKLSITSRTASACPFRAAWWTMVLPVSSVLWSSESIFGAKYSMVLTWPPCAAKCRALCPSYRQNKYKWTDDWYVHAVVVK